MNVSAIMGAVRDYGDAIQENLPLDERLARLELVRDMLEDNARELDLADAHDRIGGDFEVRRKAP